MENLQEVEGFDPMSDNESGYDSDNQSVGKESGYESNAEIPNVIDNEFKEVTMKDCLSKSKKHILKIFYQLYKIYPKHLTQKQLCKVIMTMSKENSEMLRLYYEMDYDKKLLNIKEYNPDEIYKLKKEKEKKKNFTKQVMDSDERMVPLLADSLDELKRETTELKSLLPEGYKPTPELEKTIRNIIKEELQNYFNDNITPLLDKISKLNDEFDQNSTALKHVTDIITNNSNTSIKDDLNKFYDYVNKSKSIDSNTNLTEFLETLRKILANTNSIASNLSVTNNELNKTNNALSNKLEELLNYVKSNNKSAINNTRLETDDILNEKARCEHELGLKIESLEKCNDLKKELNNKITKINSDYETRISELENELKKKEAFIETLNSTPVNKQFNPQQVTNQVQVKSIQKAINEVKKHADDNSTKISTLKDLKSNLESCNKEYDYLINLYDAISDTIAGEEDENDRKESIRRRDQIKKEMEEKLIECNKIKDLIANDDGFFD
jgi:uncharacterized coiled-coil protein SlyX